MKSIAELGTFDVELPATSLSKDAVTLKSRILQLCGIDPQDRPYSSEPLKICYGFSLTPIGHCMLATLDERICALYFSTVYQPTVALKSLADAWPRSTLEHTPEHSRQLVEFVFSQKCLKTPIQLLLKGTPFQLDVWVSLMRIQLGHRTTYTELAETCGYPRAVRAVSNAIGANQIGYLLPCHRVLRKDGGIGGYRWGIDRKKWLLKSETDWR